MSEFHGLVLVDKPVGWTSHDVVAKARRILQTKKVGHAGTLDPLASGLLILLVGNATKLSDFLLNGAKSYRVKAQLGIETDTLDVTGEIVATKSVQVDEAQVMNVINELQGKLTLPVPKYSAVKVNGKRLYKYAQNDQEVEEVMRTTDFSEVRFISFAGEEVTVELSCSKGGFVRSWVAELGRQLGCGGTVKELRRLVSSPYAVEDSVEMDLLEEQMSAGGIGKVSAAVPISQTLAHWHTEMITTEEEGELANGILPRSVKTKLFQMDEEIPGVKLVSQLDGWLMALLDRGPGGNCKIRRVFQRSE